MRTLLARGWAVGLVLRLGLSATFAADRFVNQSNPSPLPPYTNWAAAAANLAPALAAAGNGETVWVTNGTYAQVATLALSNAVTLRSVNGAAVTFVRGSGAQRCFLVQTSAVLIGFTITNGVMAGGSSNGGGVLATGAATLRDCVLAGNSVSGAGGGAAFVGNGGLVERCVFTDNLATNLTGGGYYGVAGNTVRNCLFLRNAASGGGALWLDHGGLAENCTLVSNRAGAVAGGCVVSHGGEFLNGLAWHNTAPVQPNFTIDSTGGVVRFSSTTPMPASGTGNITNPPVFAAAGDWHLSWYSPGINAGTNQSWTAGGVDLAGAPRLRAGVVDMGAYETPAIYHVSTNGSHTAPFDTWAKAATNIQAAADLAQVQGGETVLVTNGVYASPWTISLTSLNAIELRSVEGAESTLIDGGDSHACLFSMNATNRFAGFTFTRGNAGAGGGASAQNGATFDRCRFVSNRCDTFGGGASLTFGCRAVNCHFSRNSAETGGGLYLGHDSVLRNCLAMENTATMQGGGVYEDSSVVESCTVVSNSAGSWGGGIRAAGGTLLNSVAFHNSAPSWPNCYASTATADYLATQPVTGSHCVTNDPLFVDAATGNYRLGPASPCWNAGTNLSWMTGTTDLDGFPRIMHGTADIGAYELSLYHYANQAGSNAWPYLTLAAGATNIQDAIDASAAGDTVYVNDGTWRPAAELVIPPGRDITLRSYNPAGTVVLDGQNAHRVLLATNCSPRIEGFTITGGSAPFGHGGGLMLDGNPLVLDCNIISNQARYGIGGGIYMRSGGTASVCRLIGNSATGGGGAVLGSNATIRNCLVLQNSADNAGGGLTFAQGGIAENSTIVSNKAGVDGGGAYFWLGGEARNSIFYFNASPSVYSNYYCISGGAMSHCCTVPEFGIGCVTVDPLFADAAAGDHRLSAASPCLNAGTNLDWTATATDLDGVPRVVDAIVDIGAYERTPRHYVHIGGKAVWPYVTAGVGAHDVQAAVDAATDDDTVLIAAGSYTQGVEIAVNRRLTIAGSGGRDATFVVGGASNRCFTVTTNALLDGLTLTGGTAGVGGGLYLSGGGTARHCRVTGCTGTLGGGGVYFGPGGGLVESSDVTANQTLTYDGAGIYLAGNATARNCLVRDNQAHQNGGGLFFDHGGLAENCTVVSNRASSTGGGANFYLGGEARNTILYFNTADVSGPNYGGSGAALDHCCSSPSGGTGGVTGDPLFVAPAAADYRLLSGSPCIDSGTTGPPDDFDGLPRPLDGNRNGAAAWDIGAFEFVHPLADTDGNGMPDGWELEHFGSPLSGVHPADDPDGDGSPNAGEAAADTDPLDAASVFRIERFFDETEFYSVQFTSSVNRVYTLQGTADPADPASWQVSGPLRKPGPGGLMSIKEENRGARRFDRVLVELPP